MLSVNNHNVILILLTTYISSLFFVEIIKRISKYFGTYDYPDEKRKIHTEPIPTLGGIGIFLAFVLGFMLFGKIDQLVLSIFIASFLILLLGIFDDIKPVPAKYKIVIHILIACIVVFYGDLSLTKVNFLGLIINFGVFSDLVAIIVIVAIINAINLIDGLDGLCSGISSIYFFTIAIIGFLLNKFGGLDILLCVLMLGSTLGYLVHNFPPAKVYMGDAGSTFLGLMIAVIALIGFKTFTLTSLIIPLLILAIPILDTLFAIIRRKLKGQKAFSPDKEHIHHQLLKRFSKTRTVLVIYLIDFIFSAATIFYVLGYKIEMTIAYIILLFLLLFFVFKTDVIFERKKKKK